MSGKKVPVFAWDTGAAFATLRLFGPEEYGGLGDVSANASVLAEPNGRDIEEIIHEVNILLACDFSNS